MKLTWFLATCVSIASATLISDTGCGCALTKSTTTTPNASTTSTAGCALKTDWNGTTSRWCLTDQTNGQCGDFQPSFGFVDTCAVVAFTNANVLPPPALLEWDQTSTVYYTGQVINTTWRTTNIANDEWVRIQYQGQNTRTLTTGSGVNVTAGWYAIRLSDSTNSPTTGKVPVQVNLPSNALITRNTDEQIQVIQSRIQNVVVFDGTRQLVSGQSALCDDRNVSVSWRGLGQAQLGSVSVVLQRSGGSTVVGAAISGFPAAANMTVNYVLPRTFTPSGFAQYQAIVTVQEPGQNAYTGSSSSFSLSSAPSTSPSPTPSNTPTRTPTATPSITPSPSATPSMTRTPTPSVTPTASMTPSVTPSMTPTPSTTPAPIDLGAIGRAAAAAVDTTTPVIGAVVGTIAGVLILLGVLKYFQDKAMTKKRMLKLKMSAKYANEASTKYNLNTTYTSADDSTQPSVVMYSVNLGGNASSLTSKRKQEFTPKSTAGPKK
jgi:hypothetical protein